MMHASLFKRPLLILLVLYCVFLCFYLKVPTPKQGDIALNLPQGTQTVEGEVLSYPRNKNDVQSFSFYLTAVGQNAQNSKIQVYCKNCDDILRGQKLTLRGDFRAVKSPGNFGSFDWAEYLARRDIFSSFYCDGDSIVSGSSAFWTGISKIRNSILDVFNDNFQKPLNIILAGISLGEKGDVPQELYTAFQDSGAMHLLVASGSNVGFVTLVVYFICAFLGAGRITSALSAVLFAGFYTLIAGADAPLVRAFVMTFCSTLGFILGRKSGIIQGFIISALLILLFNPQSFYDVGFRMSFLATLSIILLASFYKAPKKQGRFLNFILGLVVVSLAAQLALLPVFTNYFHKFSFTALISNIILVPLSGFIMAGGFLLWLCSFIPFDIIFYTIKIIVEYMLIVFNFFVLAFADLQISKIVAPALSAHTIAAYYIVLFAALILPMFKNKKLFAGVSLMLAFIVFCSGLFVNRDAVHILYGRYNMAVLIKEGGRLNIIGAGVEGEIINNAVLSSGFGKIDCLFFAGLSKSAVYALRDLKVPVGSIYLPYGDLPKEAGDYLAQNPSTKAVMLWAGEGACSVSALKPWSVGKNGDILFFDRGGALSYKADYKGQAVETSSNLKAIKKAGKLFELPA